MTNTCSFFQCTFLVISQCKQMEWTCSSSNCLHHCSKPPVYLLCSAGSRRTCVLQQTNMKLYLLLTMCVHSLTWTMQTHFILTTMNLLMDELRMSRTPNHPKEKNAKKIKIKTWKICITRTPSHTHSQSKFNQNEFVDQMNEWHLKYRST